MVAISPRRDVTRPRIRTVWLVKDSRYWALIRGVASEAIVGTGGDSDGCRMSGVRSRAEACDFQIHCRVSDVAKELSG